jgi:hypothetical protein
VLEVPPVNNLDVAVLPVEPLRFELGEVEIAYEA